MVAMLTVPLPAPSWFGAAAVLALAVGWLGIRSPRPARLPVTIGCASMALMCLRAALPGSMTVGQPVGVLPVLGLMCMLAMLRRAFCTALLLRRPVSGTAGPVAATGCRLPAGGWRLAAGGWRWI